MVICKDLVEKDSGLFQKKSKASVTFYRYLPFSIGEADDATPIGHSVSRVHQHCAPLVLQLCDLAQRLHRSDQAVQDAATLRVLPRVGRSHSRKS